MSLYDVYIYNNYALRIYCMHLVLVEVRIVLIYTLLKDYAV